MLLNNKFKQWLGGNWGKPVKHEHNLHLDSVLEDKDEVKYKSKKKKTKKQYIYDGDVCPFCQTELPIDEVKLKEETKHGVWRVFEPRVTTCPNCQSHGVSECPACKRKTWFNPATRIYKHQSKWCGFEGTSKT